MRDESKQGPPDRQSGFYGLASKLFCAGLILFAAAVAHPFIEQAITVDARGSSLVPVCERCGAASASGSVLGSDGWACKRCLGGGASAPRFAATGITLDR